MQGGVGTFGKYLTIKVVVSKTDFGQKTQKYVGTFGLKGGWVLLENTLQERWWGGKPNFGQIKIVLLD